MAQNLRDKGYSSSMDGYQPRKQHSRQKTVLPGEADVSKGRKAAATPVQNGAAMRLPSPEQIRSTPGSGFSPAINGSRRSAPLNLNYTDPEAERSHYENVEMPWRENIGAVRDSGALRDMPLDEIKRRMEVLDKALNAAYGRQTADRMNVRTARGYVAGSREREIQPLMDYNWNVAEALSDSAWDIGGDEYAAIKDQEYLKAANAGKAFDQRLSDKQEMEFNPHAYDNAFNASALSAIGDLTRDESSVDALYSEYNALRNEYNARLARYLQGLR